MSHASSVSFLRASRRSRLVCRGLSLLAPCVLFLIDGDAQAATPAEAVAATAPAAKPAEGAVHRAMDTVVGHYVALCTDLAAEKTDTVPRHLDALGKALAAVGKISGGGVDGNKVRELAREAAAALPEADAELRKGPDVRPRKKLFALSKFIVRYVGRYRAPERRWKTYYCSMAKGSWLQPFTDEKLANPYYGKKMLRCGDAVKTRGE